MKDAPLVRLLRLLRALGDPRDLTHEMGFAREVADRILFMDRGSILERAAPADFFDRPQHPRTRKFLADIRSPFA